MQNSKGSYNFFECLLYRAEVCMRVDIQRHTHIGMSHDIADFLHQYRLATCLYGRYDAERDTSPLETNCRKCD